jgi:DNA-directed RNA polymerase specialized sigma24 family protein
LTNDGFERLIRLLDDDRECAGEKYEDIRRQMVRYFAMNDCFPEEDLADKVFDRVVQRLETCQVDNIRGFIFGVAKNVKRECYRRPRTVNIDDLPPGQSPRTEHAELKIIGEAEQQRLEQCLEKCIQKLSVSDRDLFLEYEYYAQVTRKVERLAERLNLTLGALRTKAHRIKHRVELCVRECFHGPRPAKVTL